MTFDLHFFRSRAQCEKHIDFTVIILSYYDVCTFFVLILNVTRNELVELRANFVMPVYDFLIGNPTPIDKLVFFFIVPVITFHLPVDLLCL